MARYLSQLNNDASSNCGEVFTCALSLPAKFIKDLCEMGDLDKSNLCNCALHKSWAKSKATWPN